MTLGKTARVNMQYRILTHEKFTTNNNNLGHHRFAVLVDQQENQ
tara:strand:+ start:137 stop:268 length:132 start_codon:yes stop_codon:yes gene_type:complete